MKKQEKVERKESKELERRKKQLNKTKAFALPVVLLLFPRIGFGYMTVAIPFVLLGVIIMALRVKETKGVDMDSIEYQNI